MLKINVNLWFLNLGLSILFKKNQFENKKIEVSGSCYL